MKPVAIDFILGKPKLNFVRGSTVTKLNKKRRAGVTVRFFKNNLYLSLSLCSQRSWWLGI